jgi:lipid-binding SYLF domain-containing protein
MQEESDMRKAAIVGKAMLISSAMISAAVSKGQAERLRDAAEVLQELHRTPDKDIPFDLWEKAQCVAVIPSVKKVAFVLGGEYGKGIMSCREGATWSAPSFILLEKGSVGFQIGGSSTDLVLLIMNQNGVNHLLESKVALGGEVSVAAGPVGRDARAMTDAQLKAEILSYSRSQGLFAGVDLTGGVLKPDRDDNEALYGARISARDILVSKSVRSPAEAQVFMSALRRTAPAETAN